MNLDKTLSAKNRGLRRGAVEFIILHDTAGSGTKNDAIYLANDPEGRGISVDFCIVKDGTVYQLNQSLAHYCTYHAGRNTSFRDYRNGAVNRHSVGIEIAQKVNMKGLDPAYPEVQVRAVAFICVELCKKFGLTKNDITTHKQIIRDGSRSDPRLFPWDQFWAFFAEYRGEQITPTGDSHTVIDGDTLWAIAVKYNTTVEALKGLNGMETASNLITPGQILKIRS